jgi:predicted lipoprotein with Yx(FWY)xxD motif
VVKLLALLVAAATMFVPAAAADQATLSLKVRKTRYGSILFDGRDRVLYRFTRDRRGGASRCYGACARPGLCTSPGERFARWSASSSH